MRYLEVRRHTMRVKPGQHLSQEGVALARRVGEGMGLFARVVTSTVPRAFETAIAMGFAVDEQIEALATMSDEVDQEMPWPAGFADYARAAAQGKHAAHFAHKQAALWRELVQPIPVGAAALIISHGGIVELGAVGCMPEADHAAWGPYCDFCEGVRLGFEGDRFVSIEILRVARREGG
jgi:broad specificity phosphatase PhoE